MNDIIKLYTRPELRSPNLVAAWPGICNVSLLAASYLERKLNFEKLGEIEASTVPAEQALLLEKRKRGK